MFRMWKVVRGLSRVRTSILSRHFHISPGLLGKIVQFNLSDIGEGIAEVEVKEWKVSEGDTVAQFDELCEVQSDKATVMITSRYEGTVRRLYYGINDIAPVGKPLVDIELEGAEDEAPSSESSSSSSSSEDEKPETAVSGLVSPSDPPPAARKALATPAVRRMAKQHQIILSDVPATGKFGHVLKEDVLRFLETRGSGAPPTTATTPTPPTTATTPTPRTASIPPLAPLASDRVVPIRGYARAMVRTMALANQIPHFGYCDEVCVDRLVSLRSELAEMAKERGVRMSYMPLFIKAASLALRQFPQLNASLDEAVENLTYRSSHNICVAMDTRGGLLVPNIKHCEQKNLWEIAEDLNRLHEAGKSSGLSAYDLADGTFTLSNIGSIGGTYASPVIFPPQVAIGALGMIKTEPRYEGNPAEQRIVPSKLVKVSWSADHRVIDGATMARFSNVWKRYLENPGLMIAELK